MVALWHRFVTGVPRHDANISMSFFWGGRIHPRPIAAGQHVVTVRRRSLLGDQW